MPPCLVAVGEKGSQGEQRATRRRAQFAPSQPVVEASGVDDLLLVKIVDCDILSHEFPLWFWPVRSGFMTAAQSATAAAHRFCCVDTVAPLPALSPCAAIRATAPRRGRSASFIVVGDDAGFHRRV